MTSSPDLNDVVGDVNKTKSGLNSRKGSELSPERNYHRNGTGLMRDGSIDGKGSNKIFISCIFLIRYLHQKITSKHQFSFYP